MAVTYHREALIMNAEDVAIVIECLEERRDYYKNVIEEIEGAEFLRLQQSIAESMMEDIELLLEVFEDYSGCVD